MVLEIARLTIDPPRAAEFEAAVAKAESLFRADVGCTGFALQRVEEEAGSINWWSVGPRSRRITMYFGPRRTFRIGARLPGRSSPSPRR